MATLTEYRKLSNDELQVGIYDELITEDALLGMLQFKSISGNAYKYNRESVLPTVTTHQPGDSWHDSQWAVTQKSAALTVIGVQAELDLFAKETLSDQQSQEAALIRLMARAWARKLGYYIIKGEPENNSTEFEGLDSLCRAEGRMMAADDGEIDGPGTAETQLTLDRMDQFLDMIEGGKPDALIMNKTMRRKLTALSRSSGSGVLMDQIEMFGHKVRTYDGIPILINDWITNSEQYNDPTTWPSSTATTIFAVKFGEEKQGYTILHNGPVLDPRVRELGVKQNKEAESRRLVAYVQAITYSTKSIAALGGIDSSPASD